MCIFGDLVYCVKAAKSWEDEHLDDFLDQEFLWHAMPCPAIATNDVSPREKDHDNGRYHLKFLSLTSLFNEFSDLEIKICHSFFRNPSEISGDGCVC